jgi:8-oxo-dGTP diphosphatase
MGTFVYGLGELSDYEYVVVAARYNNRWIFVRHMARESYEFPGGHIEPGEKATEAARRELYEETGAEVFELTAIFDIAVRTKDGQANGQMFFADIKRMGRKPESEIAEVREFDGVPETLTYPDDYVTLYPEAVSWFERVGSQHRR